MLRNSSNISNDKCCISFKDSNEVTDYDSKINDDPIRDKAGMLSALQSVHRSHDRVRNYNRQGSESFGASRTNSECNKYKCSHVESTNLTIDLNIATCKDKEQGKIVSYQNKAETNKTLNGIEEKLTSKLRDENSSLITVDKTSTCSIWYNDSYYFHKKNEKRKTSLASMNYHRQYSLQNDHLRLEKTHDQTNSNNYTINSHKMRNKLEREGIVGGINGLDYKFRCINGESNGERFPQKERFGSVNSLEETSDMNTRKSNMGTQTHLAFENHRENDNHLKYRLAKEPRYWYKNSSTSKHENGGHYCNDEYGIGYVNQQSAENISSDHLEDISFSSFVQRNYHNFNDITGNVFNDTPIKVTYVKDGQYRIRENDQSDEHERSPLWKECLPRSMTSSPLSINYDSNEAKPQDGETSPPSWQRSTQSSVTGGFMSPWQQRISPRLSSAHAGSVKSLHKMEYDAEPKTIKSFPVLAHPLSVTLPRQSTPVLKRKKQADRNACIAFTDTSMENGKEESNEKDYHVIQIEEVMDSLLELPPKDDIIHSHSNTVEEYEKENNVFNHSTSYISETNHSVDRVAQLSSKSGELVNVKNYVVPETKNSCLVETKRDISPSTDSLNDKQPCQEENILINGLEACNATESYHNYIIQKAYTNYMTDVDTRFDVPLVCNFQNVSSHFELLNSTISLETDLDEDLSTSGSFTALNSTSSTDRDLNADLSNANDGAIVVTCRNPKCGLKQELREAKTHYKTCHSCYTYYCSRTCRQENWTKHKKKCLVSKIKSECKHIIKFVAHDKDTLSEFSKIARLGYLTQGRGCVLLRFENFKEAETFSNKGKQTLTKPPEYISLSELQNFDKGIPYYDELVQIGKQYSPEYRFALCVSIFASNGIPEKPVPRIPSLVIHQCARIKLIDTEASPRKDLTERSNTLILTAVPGTPDGPVFEGPKSREVFFINVQKNLRDKGISLRHQYPDVYNKMCAYVADDDIFAPIALHPIDRYTGKRFMCLIMPRSDPEIAWLQDPDLLKELGLI